MKKLFLLCLLCVSIVPAFAEEGNPCDATRAWSVSTAYSGGIGSFLCNVQQYCIDQSEPQKLNGTERSLAQDRWIDPAWVKEGNFLESLPYKKNYAYPEIREAKDLSYWEPGLTPFLTLKAEDQRDAFRQNMDKVYNCSIWELKYRIHEEVMDLFSEGKSDDLKDYFTKLNEKLKTKMTDLSCTEPKAVLTTSSKKLENAPSQEIVHYLLRQQTYETCRYRFYLKYIDANVRDNIPLLLSAVSVDKNAVTDAVTPSSMVSTGAGEGKSLYDPLRLASIQARISAQIAIEDARIMRSYRSTFATAIEFFRTYPAHILLMMIERDYARLRPTLDRFLNPVSQVLYKAVNAMSKKGAP